MPELSTTRGAVLAGSGVLNLLPPNTALPVYASARLRKQQTQKRLAWLQSLFDNAEQFDAIVASGRYLKLCAMLEWASDNHTTASESLDTVVRTAVSALRRRPAQS